MTTHADTADTAAQQARNDLLQVMGMPAGRRVVWRLLDMSNPLRNPYLSGTSDDTAYNCGRIAVGQDLLVDLLHPQLVSQFAAMQAEHMSENA